jgi:hypothetical protein
MALHIQSFLIFFSLLCANFCFAQEWKLQKNSEGIKIYNRTYQNTEFKEYKAMMKANTSLNALIKLIKNDTLATNWISRVKEFRTLKTVSTTEWYTYAEMSLPFPFQNRDLISHNLLQENENHVIIHLESQPNFIAEQKDKVRMKTSKGKWEFKQLSDNEVEIVYEFFSEPAVALPQWFVQPFIVQGIYNTLEAMKKITNQ